MKANLIQKYLCEVIDNQQFFWARTNDITSPTHLNDIEEECYSQLCDVISDEDRKEFEEKLKDLYWFIRKFDGCMKANELSAKANELSTKDLMEGDWVYGIFSGSPQERITMKYSICSNSYEWKYMPISLTPEILKKNGFSLDTYSGEFMSGKWWTRNDFVIHESMNDSVGNNNFSYKYVHQLQHALRLCGIKKEIIL